MDGMAEECARWMEGTGAIMHGMGGGMMWMMAPWWLLGWALAIAAVAAVVLGVVWTAHRAKRPATTESPIDIMRRRYAQGDISSEQFEAMKRHLSKG